MNASESAASNESDDLPTGLRQALQARSLSTRAAAVEIGVMHSTLSKHLRGEYIRPDTASKYEGWLAGQAGGRRVFRQQPRQEALPLSHGAGPDPLQGEGLPVPARPHLVVDVYSGCGGLSLGFGLLGGGGHFRAVLAMDVQPSAVRVMNANRHAGGDGHGDVARVVDVTEFLGEAEVVAYYLDHVARLHDDGQTRLRLDALCGRAFPRFLSCLRVVDERFLDELRAARRSAAFRESLACLQIDALDQTSVAGLLQRLRFPRLFRGELVPPATLWSDVAAAADSDGPDRHPAASQAPVDQALARWEAGLLALERKETKTAKGQLTSSGRRIASFAAWARTEGFAPVRDAWCRWQAARTALRASTFGDLRLGEALRHLYRETYPVSVLLGGPPCQGFSRIGRGKIRSLREADVHAHHDDLAGDSRNLLYRNYVLVVGALRPLAFMFENVQQFQSSVKVGDNEFLATVVLADAIKDMSGDRSRYAVSARTIDASHHAVPQTRQRYFMVGLRGDAFEDAHDLAARCLALPWHEEVPMAAALEGLPAPHVHTPDGGAGSMAPSVPVETTWDPSASAGIPGRSRYRGWVRQARPGQAGPPPATDAHATRPSRLDDIAFFGMMGPGRRWMDYRVDLSPTLGGIRAVLRALADLDPETTDAINGRLPGAAARLPDAATARELLAKVDGSLALRLMLEQWGAREGTAHHLLRDAYLHKEEGNHGDWLTRLDADRPCRTIVAHIAKDAYGYVHPSEPRTLSVREAARVQAFPDWFSFGAASMTDAFRMIGNAVPPLLANALAANLAAALSRARAGAHHAAEATPAGASAEVGMHERVAPVPGPRQAELVLSD